LGQQKIPIVEDLIDFAKLVARSTERAGSKAVTRTLDVTIKRLRDKLGRSVL